MGRYAPHPVSGFRCIGREDVLASSDTRRLRRRNTRYGRTYNRLQYRFGFGGGAQRGSIGRCIQYAFSHHRPAHIDSNPDEGNHGDEAEGEYDSNIRRNIAAAVPEKRGMPEDRSFFQKRVKPHA